VRRRIRAAELLYLAGDLERSLEHLKPLDTGRLATADLERALPLVLDLTDFLQGTARATAIIVHAARAAGAEEADPRRRALVLALASDVVYGIPGGKRAAAIEAISCAEAADVAANAALHRALVNLFIAKVTAAEGLDTSLLDRAVGLEASLPPTRLHDSADSHRGWSRYAEDLDTARAALQRSIARARDIGEDLAVATFSYFLATTEVLGGDYAAAAAAVDAADAAAAWYDWPPHPWHVEPRCELLIRDGDLDSAVGLVDGSLPGGADATIPARITARFMGACLRGKVSAWRGDHAATVQHLERAARCAEQLDWTDPGVRSRLDIPLAEAYVAVGRPGDARRISAGLREADLLLPGDLLIADQGTAFYGAAGLTLPDGAQLVGQPLWASIGWTLPAALGASLAAPDRRVVLIAGDGAMQQTAAELGTLLGQGLAPIVVVLSNGGYTIERAIHRASAGYHEIPAWDWTALPGTVAPASSPVALRVETSHELAWALNGSRPGCPGSSTSSRPRPAASRG